MTDNKTIGIILGVAIFSIVVGAVIGALLMTAVDNGTDKGGNNGTDQNTVILRNDAIAQPETTWDSEHHNLIDLNSRVRGRVLLIEMVVEDEEDQYHFLLVPDQDFKATLNTENMAQLRGALMIEIMKSDMFILPRLFIGQHLEIQGPLVTDIRAGHGWNEIDPALLITAI